MALPSRLPISVPRELEFVARIFERSGRQCWLVGGAVRDALLGRPVDDFDLATDAPPQTVRKLFRRSIPTGIRHGTVSILRGDYRFETTTFRRDGAYTDARHPDSVTYSGDIHDDLSRRDFTVNALAWNLIQHRFLDPHDGLGDLEQKIIRAVGTPGERFAEDALRPIRACRFASQLEFTVESGTLAALGAVPEGVRRLSAERVWDELGKILGSPKPSIALGLFRDTGLLGIILPELDACIGTDPRGRRMRDAFDRCTDLCDRLAPDNPALRTAALFHEASPAPPRGGDTPDDTLSNPPDEAAARIAEGALRRLKTSNALRERVVRLVRHHHLHLGAPPSDSAVRRFMRHAGPDLAEDIIALGTARAADPSSTGPASAAALDELLRRVRGVQRRGEALSIGELGVNGRVLMEELGMRSGKPLGALLEHLLEGVLDNPALNEPGALLEAAKRFMKDNESRR